LQPWLRPYADFLLRVAEYNGIPYTVTSVRRSRAAQQALWDRYQSGQSELPAAPPGHSMHELGLAFDVVFGGDYWSPQQKALGQLWQRMGGAWGASKDPVHFYVR